MSRLLTLIAHLKTSLIREIKDIQRRLNITMIYVTHDQSEAFEIADRIVVMKDGRIMQQGTPWDIYHHSKNLFVARFVGKNNIFKPCDHGCPKFFKHCRAGQAVTVRPEDIEIKEDGTYKGVVKDLFYKGDRTEYLIETGGTDLLASASGNKSLEKGTCIAFDIKRYHSI